MWRATIRRWWATSRSSQFYGQRVRPPEWIDFPREGNGWSHHYCRRQWSLVENSYLKYGQLEAFDKAMLAALRQYGVLTEQYPVRRLLHQRDHLLAYERGGLVFAFNFGPRRTCEDVIVPVTHGCDHEVLFTSDDPEFGVFGNIGHGLHSAFVPGQNGPALRLGLPPRTAMVLKPTDRKEETL